MSSLTFLLFAAVAVSSINPESVRTGLCVPIVEPGGRFPTVNSEVRSCSDFVEVKIQDVRTSVVDDWLDLTIGVRPEGRAELAAFLSRNMRLQTVLVVDGRSFLNLFIMSEEASSLRVAVDSSVDVSVLTTRLDFRH